MDVQRPSVEQKYKEELMDYYVALQRSSSLASIDSIPKAALVECFPTPVHLFIKETLKKIVLFWLC
jgi:hypothetical protein